MARAMGNPWFGSKASSGLWQALVALMPPHAVYIETHLGGGAVMKRKPAALRNIGIDLDARALSSFECGHAVELVNADCHGYLADFAPASIRLSDLNRLPDNSRGSAHGVHIP